MCKLTARGLVISKLTDLNRWRLGTCLPQGVLNHNGSIFRQRNSLSSLSLVTDASCPHGGQYFSGLRELKAIRSLQWNGIHYRTEVDALRECIEQNRHHLKTLNIGFAIRGNGFDFSEDILGLPFSEAEEQARATTRKVLSLEHLSLTRTALPAFIQPNKGTVFHSLRELALWDCPEVLAFLDLLSDSAFPLQIKRFELCCDNTVQKNETQRDLEQLLRFLLSFKGLIDLHLRLSGFRDTEYMHSAIAHHRSSLKRLIYHERKIIPGNYHDLDDMRDCIPLWLCNLPQTLDFSEVSHLGLSTPPSFMVWKSPAIVFHMLTDVDANFEARSSSISTAHSSLSI